MRSFVSTSIAAALIATVSLDASADDKPTPVKLPAAAKKFAGLGRPATPATTNPKLTALAATLAPKLTAVTGKRDAQWTLLQTQLMALRRSGNPADSGKVFAAVRDEITTITAAAGQPAPGSKEATAAFDAGELLPGDAGLAWRNRQTLVRTDSVAWTRAAVRPLLDAEFHPLAAPFGRLPLDDYRSSGDTVTGATSDHAGGAVLVATGRVPRSAASITVSSELTIDLAAMLAARGGAATARLSVTISALPELGASDVEGCVAEGIDVLELAVAGAGSVSRPYTDGRVTVPVVCSFRPIPVSVDRDLEIRVDAGWDVDVGTSGQFLMLGSLTAAAPQVTIINGHWAPDSPTVEAPPVVHPHLCP